ncbi:MAG: SMC-Scp complex subunit ScpB [Candidatus Eisenbacteria bacterium]|nr:SMC-Scp complex subunit ScpB [Candidatus Eisenbacteria bacterium]
MEQEKLRLVIEALLFASDSPLAVKEMQELLESVPKDSILKAVEELSRDYDTKPNAVKIMQVAGGFQVCTREEYSPWLEKLKRSRRSTRLSRAALETAAIIAYKQPVTKAVIEEIRGVDSTGTLHTLLERGLVTIKGRAPGAGRPLLYGTTRQFLLHFGLNELDELPKLSELKEILDEKESAGAEENAGTEPQ